MKYMVKTEHIAKAFVVLQFLLLLMAAFWFVTALMTLRSAPSDWVPPIQEVQSVIDLEPQPNSQDIVFDYSFDPFHPGSEIDEPVDLGEDAPETTLDLTLIGRRSGDNGTAILRLPDNSQSVFRIEDEILPGVVLKSVNVDFIAIAQDGRLERLTFDRPSETLLLKDIDELESGDGPSPNITRPNANQDDTQARDVEGNNGVGGQPSPVNSEQSLADDNYNSNIEDESEIPDYKAKAKSPRAIKFIDPDAPRDAPKDASQVNANRAAQDNRALRNNDQNSNQNRNREKSTKSDHPINSLFSFTPRFEDSQILGYSIRAKRADINPALIGLRNGDIITRIGDQDLAQPNLDFAAIIDRLPRQGQVNVELLRNGQSLKTTIKTP